MLKKSAHEEHRSADLAIVASEPTKSSHNHLRNAVQKLKLLFGRRDRVITGAVMVAAVVIIFAVPSSRYTVLGGVIKRPVTFTVVDASTRKPVSDATIAMAGRKAKTSAAGKVNFSNVPVGNWQVVTTKRYYSDLTTAISVPVFGSPKPFKLSFVAIGVRVTVKVVNKITSKSLAGVRVAALGTSVTTDATGQATIVLPAGRTTVPGTVTLSGYNNLPVVIANAQTDVSSNTFAIVPSGRIFYLDKRTGVINVMKANLDGSDPTVILAGTGNESDTGTILLASRDWKYLALDASRNPNQPELYLINTTTDQLSVMDQGNVTFTLVGWAGDDFIYEVERPTTVQNDGAGTWSQTELKSYDPATDHIVLIDQTQTQDVGATPSGGVLINQTSIGQPVLVDSGVIYTKFWSELNYSSVQSYFTGETQQFIKVSGDGSSKSTLFSISPSGKQSVQVLSDKPDEVYFQVSGQDYWGTPAKNVYYEYEDGKIQAASDITDSTFNSDNYPTYLLSPSGKQTFWYEPLDGKNTLFTGDNSGGSPKQIAGLSDYTPYGWYTDSYVLVSKNQSELYIAPADFSTPPLFITNYHRPAITYDGYGGGYGGQ